jgi:hypothetical protein
VLASKHSGLIESVGEGGILIKDFRNSNDWIRTVKNLIVDRGLLLEYRYKARAKFKELYKISPTQILSELLRSKFSYKYKLD